MAASLQQLVSYAPRALRNEILSICRQVASWGKTEVDIKIDQDRWDERVACKAITMLNRTRALRATRTAADPRVIHLCWRAAPPAASVAAPPSPPS